MDFKTFLLLSVFTLQLQINAAEGGNRVLEYEVYQSAEELEVVIVKISPQGARTKTRVGRQDEDEEEATTPYIPAIIPGVTKIFNGILTGNLNEIFHGSTSFAPKETANAINTVYNQVVGLPPPRTRGTSTQAPLAANATANATATTSAPDDDDDDESDIYDLNKGEQGGLVQ